MAGARRGRKEAPYHKKGLQEQIEDPNENGVRTHPRAEKKRGRKDDEPEDELISARLSGRIMKVAREQQVEIDAEDDAEERTDRGAQIHGGALKAAMAQLADSDDDDDSNDGGDGGGSDGGAGPSRGWDTQDTYDAEDEAGATAEDERALAAFMAPGHEEFRQQSLGDLILSKLREQQKEQGLAVLPREGEKAEPEPEGLDERVLAVYRGVGGLLSRYTVGRVPKAFKIIPNLKNWEEVLYLTNPDEWSPQAVYEATSMFVSNLNSRLAQRFLALVLLPRVRQEIREQHKLHFAIFQALKKATYKPAAFYKGLLLPLCQSRTCTLREAVVFSSVLRRVSIPALHSSAALLRLAELPYCGTTSFFVRVLLDKKYALPYRVIDALVDHFLRFADDERQMPVVWHQSLLCFVQRYREEIRSTDKAALRKLCTMQTHYQVTPEVVRELVQDMHRETKKAAPAAVGGAPTPMHAQPAAVGRNVAEDAARMAPVLMMEDD